MDNNPALEFLKKVYVKFLDTSQMILFFVAILLILYMFVLQPHEVSGLSMFPTFNDKELLLSYLLDVNLRNIKHGDVVVFHAPKEEDKLFIKRVIGMSGDKIKLENGLVYLNGKKLDESGYLRKEISTYGGPSYPDGTELTVPDGELFVMGDNRLYSSDSRAWGPLKYEKLIGRSLLRFWPPNTFTIIQRNPYK